MEKKRFRILKQIGTRKKNLDTWNTLKIFRRSSQKERQRWSEIFKLKERTSHSVNKHVPSVALFIFQQINYMTKYECCFNCYIQYIEDREERWKSGWRPNNNYLLIANYLLQRILKQWQQL